MLDDEEIFLLQHAYGFVVIIGLNFFRILLTCINHSPILDQTKYVDFDSAKRRVISTRQRTDITRGRLYCPRYYARDLFVELLFIS